MKKVACVYHSIDLDGWFSGAIASNFHRENNKVTTIGYNYGDKVPDLSEFDRVVMCDVSIDNDEMVKLGKRLGSEFIYIDHHKGKIIEVEEAFKRANLDLTGLFNKADDAADRKAACELTWEYFMDSKIPRIVEAIGAYDCFRHQSYGVHESYSVMTFQYGARASFSGISDAITALNSLTIIDSYNSIREIGVGIYKYLKTDARQVIKYAFPIRIKDIHGKAFNFLCVNKDRFNPINFGIDYHSLGYDGFASFYFDGTQWAFSVYNDDGRVNCTDIAKTFGGGGHAGASGFRIEDISSFLKYAKSF